MIEYNWGPHEVDWHELMVCLYLLSF